MTEIELSKFIRNLVEKTDEMVIDWAKLEIEELRVVLKDVSNYYSISGGYFSTNKKGTKRSVIGKYKAKVYYEEDQYYYQDYYFLAIANVNDFDTAIIFLEDELRSSDVTKLGKLYRNIELKVNDVSSILDDWF
jgi:hypothetical protein